MRSPACALPKPRSGRSVCAGWRSLDRLSRGEARPDRDVDLLVEFNPELKRFDRFIALAELLERLLGRRVELVTTEALSPFIGPPILADAADVLRAA